MPSLSRVNEVAAAPTAARVAPEKWQFVSVNEPRRNQDRKVISIVRAHAMRNVRRKQRLELTIQHQKRLKAKAPESDYADSGVTAEQSPESKPDDWLTGDMVDVDRPMALSEMLSEHENISDRPASTNEDETGAEHDEGALESHDLGRYGGCETRALGCLPCGTSGMGTLNPECLVGDGVSDPFNTMPIVGCAKYNNHVLHHFTSIMAIDCLPVDQRKGQNPLTKIWLPYALQDPTLFLATLTFAAVHLEIMSGSYRSPRTLFHKGDSIRAVNAKLGNREHALSNESIGAVAMLAAIESILGNYKELRIHMKGLQRMVYMRGGLQSLGWGGVLHMFISWYRIPSIAEAGDQLEPSKTNADWQFRQDLLSSAMMASAPGYEQTPCCLLIQGNLLHSNPVFPALGLSTELCGEIATSFQNMRYLSRLAENWGTDQDTLDIMTFNKTRTAIVHRLLSIANQKPASEMTNLDYHVELCRLAALIYIKVALHMYTPLCATIRTLKTQLVDLIKQGEANCRVGVGARPQPASATWALFVGGILSLKTEEEEWFSQRLAKGIRASGVETWAEMEDRLQQICWLDHLNTPTCQRLWDRVETIHAEYWAAQVRYVASDWDRMGAFYWFPNVEEKAYASAVIPK